MIRNYIKTAWRRLSQNKLYALINITGLSVGLAACLLIGVYIMYELSYDRFHRNAKRIVRTTMEYGQAGTVNSTASTGTRVGPQFARSFPAVEKYVRTFISHNVIKTGDKAFEEPRILYADDPFFEIFSFSLIAGKATEVLDAPDKVVISRSMAKKYFGEQDPLNQILSSGGKELRVSGVFDDVPRNSQLKFDFVTQFLNLGNSVKQETWWNANWITYFLLRDQKSLESFQHQVDEYMGSKAVRDEAGLEGNNYLRYHFEPLEQVHLHSSLSGFEPNGNIRYIYIFSIIALLVLIIACANYTNLATAQAAGRSGEIGVRKVMGASRKQVFLQFIGESALLTGLATLFALVIAVLLLPSFSRITGTTFHTTDLTSLAPLLTLIITAFFVSFLAGLYPALILSATQVMQVLRKGFSFTGGRQFLRKGLIVLQFGISIFLIVYTVVIVQQMRYLQTKSLGYDKDHVLVLPIGGHMLNDFQSLKDAFARVPGVESVTASYETPEYVEWGDGITAEDEHGKHEISINAMPVDLDFIKTMKMELAAGRDFLQSDFAIMDTSNDYAHFRQPYIINEALARKLGWKPEDAVNRVISKNVPGPVVGVVKDFNFSSLHDPIGPLLIFLGRDYSRDFMLRLDGKDLRGTISRLEIIWKQRVAGRPFSYHFLDEDYNKLYLAEQRSSALFSITAGLAILLACLGLFGLAAFSTVQRTREIGIRRVLGASTADITFLFGGHFLKLVMISLIVSFPLAWFAGNKWLQDFAFRIQIQWWVLILPALIVLLIAFGTVSFHAIRASWANPVKALRSE